MSRRLAAAAVCAAPLAIGLAVALAVTGPAAAQARRPFLYINQERILTGSERGRALLGEEERARDALRTEARGLEATFEAEERALTEQRPRLSVEEFRVRSNDFDARVVKARADQDARAAALAQEFDQKRRAFYADAAPILVRVMEQAGALAIFDETTVLIADQSLNVTDEVVAAIDAALASPGGAPGAPAPGTQAPGPLAPRTPAPEPLAPEPLAPGPSASGTPAPGSPSSTDPLPAVPPSDPAAAPATSAPAARRPESGSGASAPRARPQTE